MADEAQPPSTTVEGSAPATTEDTKDTSGAAADEKKTEGLEKDGAEPAGETAPTGEQSAISENADESKIADDATDDKAEGAATTQDAAEASPNGTPASSNKKANGKRKSTGASEQRSKKLNKKKSAAKITHLDAQPGDFYFARQKGYPPWPAVICDESMLPGSLLATRPASTKQPDGSYKEQYADGGKRVADRTFPVMYLHTNEFAWITNTDLAPLEPENCKDVAEKGKSKLLIEAYKVAAENHDLEHFKHILAEHQRLLEEEIRAQEEREAAKEAAKEAKKDKKKRKSAAKGDEEDEDGEGKPKSSKKRKKDEGEAEGTKKTKTTPKLKLNPTPKTGGSGKKAASGQATKAKGGSAKKRGAKAGSEDDETADSTPKAAKKPLDPAEAKKQKETEVLFLRHKLQKGFLSRDHPPQEDAMDILSAYLKKLESYDNLEVSIIRETRINRVLKNIVKLHSIPREEEFNFRGRSVDILSKWKSLLDSDIPAKEDTKKDTKEGESKPTSNGVANGDKNKSGDAAEEEKTSAAPDEDVQMKDAPESTEKDDEKQEPEPVAPKEGETAAEPTAVTAEA